MNRESTTACRSHDYAASLSNDKMSPVADSEKKLAFKRLIGRVRVGVASRRQVLSVFGTGETLAG
jgi:hypothetical protein